MTKNNTVDTAQKGQTTIDKTPIDKVKTLKSAEKRRKAREEQFSNFRINALIRRCKRYGFDKEKTEQYVEKLKKQMDAPKEYHILIMFNQVYPRKKMNDGETFKPDIEVFIDDIKGKNISYLYKGDSFVRIDGNQDTLSKIREIAPTSAKIYPYAKKMESVIPKEEREVTKKPSNNTAEKKAAAKATAFKGRGSVRAIHRMQKGRLKDSTTGELKPLRLHGSEKFNKNGKLVSRRKPSSRPNAETNKTKVKIGKRAWVKAHTTQAILSLAERVAKQKATTVQLNAKKSSKGLEKASTNVKKAA